MSNVSSVRPGCLLSEGLPLSRSVFRGAAAELTFSCDVHFHRRASSESYNKPQTNNPLHLDFSLSSHSPRTSGREHRKTSTRLKSLTSDLSGECMDFTSESGDGERSGNFSYSSSNIKEGGLSPYHWEQALNPYLKWEQHILLFSASEAWYGMVGSLIFSPSIKDQRPGETSASTFQLLLLTVETEVRLRCKSLWFGSRPRMLGPATTS